MIFIAAVSPIWLTLLYFVGKSLFRLALTFPEVDLAADLRWHALAFVGLVTSFLALAGAPLAIFRTYATERQTRAQEEGLTTDRIRHAVEGLGAEKQVYHADNCGTNPTARTVPNLEVRIGAIYALERISEDSARDRINVSKIITEYLRRHSIEYDERSRTRSDVEAAFQALSPISKKLMITNHEDISYILDLNSCRIIGANVSQSTLFSSDFRNSRLSSASLSNSIIVKCRFFKAEIKDTQLEDSKFDRVNFSQSKIEESCLDRTHVKNCDFSKSTLNNNSMQHLSVSGSSFAGTTMIGNKLEHAKITRCDARGANVSNSELDHCILEQVDMRGAKLSCSSLKSATIRHCRLAEADLTQSELTNSFFDTADLRGANISNSTLLSVQLSNADITGVRFDNSDLRGSNFSGSNLRGISAKNSNLSNSNCAGVDFSEAVLDGSVFKGTIFDKLLIFKPYSLFCARFQDVDLSRTALSDGILEEAFGDASVRLPEGYRRPDHWPETILGNAEFDEHFKSFSRKINSIKVF